MRASVQAWLLRALVAGVVVAASLIGVGAPANACMCAYGPKAALDSATAVFVAHVGPGEPRPGPMPFVRHRVEVEEVYHGRVASRVKIDVLKGLCGIRLDPGRRYLISSEENPRQQAYQVSLCSWARTVSPEARTDADALFGAPYEPVSSPPSVRTDGARDEVEGQVWRPAAELWLYPLAATVLVGGVAWGVWRWRRARS